MIGKPHHIQASKNRKQPQGLGYKKVIELTNIAYATSLILPCISDEKGLCSYAWRNPFGLPIEKDVALLLLTLETTLTRREATSAELRLLLASDWALEYIQFKKGSFHTEIVNRLYF